MIFSTIIMLSLGSYLSLINVNLKSSHRSFHSSSAINLAENGLEEGLWAINRMRAGDPSGFATANWVISGTKATGTFDNVFASGTTTTSNSVVVVVDNYNLSLSTNPVITAHAKINLSNAAPVDKWVQLTLDAVPHAAGGSTAPAFPGLVAKYTIRFNGNNPSVDSWNSDPDGDASTPSVPFSTSVKNDKGFVGSLAVAVDQVTVQNADILGFVSTNRDADLTNNVGPNGSILAKDSPSGTKIDSRRVSTDFIATLPPVSNPTATAIMLGGITSNTSLPRTGDVRSSDGKYYYQASGINLAASEKLIIGSHNVVLVVPYPYNIKFAGNAELKIDTGSSLEIYAGGTDIDITGNGLTNGTRAGNTLTESEAQAPINFKLWGTTPDLDNNAATADQSIKIAGNGALSGVVYAPNADVTVNGNGAVMGSVVGNSIVLSGNAAFHYDESLGSPAWNKTSDTKTSPLVVSRWRELFGAERHFTL